MVVKEVRKLRQDLDDVDDVQEARVINTLSLTQVGKEFHQDLQCTTSGQA